MCGKIFLVPCLFGHLFFFFFLVKYSAARSDRCGMSNNATVKVTEVTAAVLELALTLLERKAEALEVREGKAWGRFLTLPRDHYEAACMLVGLKIYPLGYKPKE